MKNTLRNDDFFVPSNVDQISSCTLSTYASGTSSLNLLKQARNAPQIRCSCSWVYERGFGKHVFQISNRFFLTKVDLLSYWFYECLGNHLNQFNSKAQFGLGSRPFWLLGPIPPSLISSVWEPSLILLGCCPNRVAMVAFAELHHWSHYSGNQQRCPRVGQISVGHESSSGSFDMQWSWHALTQCARW